MKRFLIGVLVLVVGVSCSSFASDLFSAVNTENGVLYNKSYRDGKDGNNYPTSDVISANLYMILQTSQTSVKTSGGYLKGLLFTAACSDSTTNYVLADSATAGNSYATMISTIAKNSSTVPLYIPMDIRFNNGLAVNLFLSTCTVTAIYR